VTIPVLAYARNGKGSRTRVLHGGLALLVLLPAASFFFVDKIPPTNLTLTRIWLIRQRILMYARQHNTLPPHLAALPLRQGYDNEIIDTWGNPVLYRVSLDGAIELKSLGADGQLGGTGANADIVQTYRAKQPDRAWSDDVMQD
jgi:hypothetical protein